MRDVLLVGAGGFLGSASRYLIGGLFLGSPGSTGFPVGTLVVNVSGCLAIGVLAAWGDASQAFSPGTRLFLMTGLVGGYTTFSAFALETFALGRDQDWAAGIVNVAAQMLLGLVAVWIGYRLVALFTA